MLGSCADSSGQSAARPGSTSVPAGAEEDRRIISHLTDTVLQCLSTHDYERLAGLLEPAEKSLSGSQVADLLLGRTASSVVLERWDAERIEVRFDDTLQWATATADVSCRRLAGRRPQQAVFSVCFHRSGLQGPWRLSVLGRCGVR